MLYGSVRRPQVVVEDEEELVQHFLVATQRNCARIEVVVTAASRSDIPPEADGHGGQLWGLLAQRDVCALGQGHTHDSTPSSIRDRSIQGRATRKLQLFTFSRPNGPIRDERRYVVRLNDLQLIATDTMNSTTANGIPIGTQFRLKGPYTGADPAAMACRRVAR